MKKTHIIIALLLITIQQVVCQTQNDKLLTFRSDVLPQFSAYFESAMLNESGQMVIVSTEKYALLPADSKKSVMDKLIISLKESLIIVTYQTTNELWAWDSAGNKALSLDKWDINSNTVARPTETIISKTAMHPWFVYLGGMGQYTSDHQITAALNSRIGFFLLRDRWDFAWTLSMGASGVDTTDLGFNISYGVMSKYYFPLKKIKLSPNVGIDLGNNVYMVDDQSTNSSYFSLLTGISWFVGKGSLDLEFKIGDEFTTLIGYTFYPGLAGNKKKK